MLSFKDIHANGFHLKTHCENEQEFFCVYLLMNANWSASWRNSWVNVCHYDSNIESHVVAKHDIWDTDSYRLWFDQIGQPGRDIMVQILRNSHGHPFFRSKRRHSRPSITMKHGGDPGDIDVTRTRLQLPGGRPVNSSSNWGAPAFPRCRIGPLQCSLLVLKAYSLAK